LCRNRQRNRASWAGVEDCLVWPGSPGAVCRDHEVPNGGGLDAAERARREQLRLAAAKLTEAGGCRGCRRTGGAGRELTALVKTRLSRMQYRPGLLAGFLASTQLDLTPFGNPHH
jgi:hypothetical protein